MSKVRLGADQAKTTMATYDHAGADSMDDNVEVLKTGSGSFSADSNTKSLSGMEREVFQIFHLISR